LLSPFLFFFFPFRGDIVLIADSQGVRDIYSAEAARVLEPAAPVSVLVNKGTASAAEVLAGTIITWKIVHCSVVWEFGNERLVQKE
jgi:hypothetical protein